MATEIQPNELRGRLRAGEDVYVLDVREPAEVAEWAFPGAVNIPLGELGGRTGELPSDRSIVVVCHAGVRSEAAADALSNAGWPAVSLAGGAVAWVSTDTAS
jgi:sulfur-carrier protein adenylyltransferase/sulfurtransferase